MNSYTYIYINVCMYRNYLSFVVLDCSGASRTFVVAEGGYSNGWGSVLLIFLRLNEELALMLGFRMTSLDIVSGRVRLLCEL